ncbi:NUDIX domain-containing protein [Chitinophaga sp. Cy-1792]|uniref:NUDIX hydrolase n=1 Tax=Chitinophaga sp. Cy-1792 TaxID=2608339 RepID=UPI001422CCF9|nr:NUDIX domain-containing protein [Chitinophaga sp. Cy-1792]NIG53003.1 NUDIX domain-containing protein [Chitinophaga sp. Cy-1792]
MRYINTAGLIVIENRKLMLAFSRNKGAWYLPGGKVDPGETDLEALHREIREELDIDLNKEQLQLYYYMEAPAFGEKDVLMKQHAFICQLQQTPQPTAEIAAIRFFSEAEYKLEEHQVIGVINAFRKLREDGLVD